MSEGRLFQEEHLAFQAEWQNRPAMFQGHDHGIKKSKAVASGARICEKPAISPKERLSCPDPDSQ